MFKKLKMMCLVIFCGGMLTGCMQMVDMTSQETNMVTESMAGLLLKYDKNSEGDLVYQESKDLRAEIESKENAKVTPVTVSGEEKNNEKLLIQDNSNSGNMITTNYNKKATDGKSDKQVQYVDLNSIIGNNKFKVDFKKYELSNNYYGNISNQAFTIDPSKNNQLLIAYFDITNFTKKSQNLNLAGSNIQYQLHVGEEKYYNPLMTLLLNDIQYINLDFAVKETKEAVILYEIPKDINLSKVEMIVSKDANTSNVKMK